MTWLDNGGNISSPSNPCFIANATQIQQVTGVSGVGNSLTVTVPAQNGLTACIDEIIISGSPLAATSVNDSLTSTGLAANFQAQIGLGLTITFPVKIPMLGIQANGPNTAVTFTLGAILLTTLTMSIFYHYQ